MVESKESFVRLESIATLCVEYWKLVAVTEKALQKVHANDGKRLEAQLKFSQRQLDVLLQEIGLRLVDFSGECFLPGLAVSVDNLNDFRNDEDLIISKTLEPTVMSDMTVIRLGRVLVSQNKQKKD
jgi:hypothetical protein